MPQRILALDIAGGQVRAAVAERSWNSLRLIGLFGQQRSADESDLAPALNRLIAETGRPDIVVSALAGERVANRVLTLPFTDRRRLLQSVPFALEEHLPFPIDDCVVAFSRIGREGTSSLVMGASARKDDLRRHLELLAQASLDPKVVTLGPLALAGLMAHAQPRANGADAISASDADGNGVAPEESRMVVDVDDGRASLLLLDAEGIPRAMRTIEARLEPGDGAAAAASIMTTARQTLLAHSGDSEHSEVILTGPLAGLVKRQTDFAHELKARVHTADEFEYHGMPDGFEPEAVKFATCLGMILGEAPNARAEMLNFRQGEFVFRGRTGDFAPLYSSARLAVAVAIVALLHFVLGLSNSYHRLSILESQANAVAAQALGHAPKGEPRDALRAAMTESDKRLHLLGGGSGHGTALDTILELSSAIPPRLQVQTLDLEIDESGVKLSGKADSFATIDQVKKSLGQHSYFENIQVNDAKVTSNSGEVEFNLSAALRDSAGGGN